MTGIPSVLELARDEAVSADNVSAYVLDEGPQAGMTVVEVFDAHQVVLGRTITDAPGTREDVTDLVLGRSALERCSDFSVDPLGKGKRIVAAVTLSVSQRTSAYETEREQHGYGASA